MTTNATSIEKEIIGAFEAAGYTPAQAAGIAGNAQVESSFNPTDYNASEGAVGLFQEEGGRLTALKAYAAKTKGSIWSAATQIGFAIQEAVSRGNAAQVKATTTPEQAAYVWDRKFEVSSTASIGQREANATSIYAQIKAGNLTGTAPSSATLTAAEGFKIPDPISNGGLANLGSAGGSVISSAATGVWAEIEPVVFKLAFGGAALALVVAGLYSVARPQVHEAEQAATTAAKAAAV